MSIHHKKEGVRRLLSGRSWTELVIFSGALMALMIFPSTIEMQHAYSSHRPGHVNADDKKIADCLSDPTCNVEEDNVPITGPGTGAGNCNPGDPLNQEIGCSEQAISNREKNCAKHDEPATCTFGPGKI
jgi:hypothetical protein